MSGDRDDAMSTEGAADRRRSEREHALRSARRRHPSAGGPRVAPGTATDALLLDDGEALEPGAASGHAGPVVVVLPADQPPPGPD